MALTRFRRQVCHLLAARRRARGDSYVAGGVALSVALDAQRLSRDPDLFHDTTDAVAASWDDDRRILEADGYGVTPLRERPGFVEAMVARGADTLLVEWVHDNAFRFFPLVEHEELGLTLHPSSRYSATEVSALAFDGPAPDAAALARRWHLALDLADGLIQCLPADHLGEVVLSSGGHLFRGGPEDLRHDLAEGRVTFHAGRLGGALPRLRGEGP